MNETLVSREKKMTMVLLCHFLGWFGIHRFYTGKTLSGVLMLLTLGCGGIWVLIDMGLIITGKFTDKEGKRITEWT
jgi:TM2 domain-containing membrane protein YozV